MTIEIDTGVFLSVSGAIVGAWWGLAKLMIRQFEVRQDERFELLTNSMHEQKEEQSAVMVEIRRVETEVSRFQIDAASHYMTRTEAISQHQQILDAIRSLGSRIDAMHGRNLGIGQ